MEFKYLARVLCIYRDGIQKPNTTADLINLGTAKQMLVAMQFGGSDLGKHEEIPGRDGAENARWAALHVHNELQRDKGPIDLQGGGGQEEYKPKQDQLPRILKAMGLMQVCSLW